MNKLRRQGIVKGAFVTAFSKGTARFLRFLLLIVIASKFGDSLEADAYFIIQTLTLLFLTLNDTIFNMTLIPVLVNERVNNGEEEAKKLASSAFAYLNLFFFCVSLVFFIFAGPLAGLLASKLPPEGQELTALLIRIVAPIPFLAGLGGVPAAIFFSHRSFILPSLTFLFYGISSIISALLLTDLIGIKSIPWGATFGVGLQAAVLIVVLWKAGGLSFSFNPHKAMKGLMKLTAPRILGRILVSVSLAVDKALATGVGIGQVTCLTMAFRVNQFPIALLIAPLGTSMPFMSEQAAGGDLAKMREFISRIIGLISFMVLPVMAGMIIMRVPLLGLLFERGKFDSAATATTASAFLYFNLGLLFMSVNIFFLAALFALRDARTPAILAILDCGLNIILDVILVRIMGIDGIALAKASVAVMNTVVFLFVIQKRVGLLDWHSILTRSLLRILTAAVLTGISVWFIVEVGSNLWSGNRLLTVAAGILIGLGVYVLACTLLGVREMKEIRGLIARKLSSKGNKTDGGGEKKPEPPSDS